MNMSWRENNPQLPIPPLCGARKLYSLFQWKLVVVAMRERLKWVIEINEMCSADTVQQECIKQKMQEKPVHSATAKAERKAATAEMKAIRSRNLGLWW